MPNFHQHKQHNNTLFPLQSGTHNPVKATFISAIDSLKKYGVTKSHMRFLLQNVESIQSSNKAGIATYKIFHWDNIYTLQSIKDGIITKDDVQYHVIFSGCTRQDILKSKSQQAWLSFRCAKPEYNLPAFVLIKPLHTSKNLTSSKSIVKNYTGESK